MDGETGASISTKWEERLQDAKEWGVGEEDSARRVWKSVGITVVECRKECMSKAGRQTAVLEGPPSGHQHEFLMAQILRTTALKHAENSTSQNDESSLPIPEPSEIPSWQGLSREQKFARANSNCLKYPTQCKASGKSKGGHLFGPK